MNDSERIIPGNLAILRNDWAIESVSNNRYSADCYLSHADLNSSKDNYVALQAPQTQFSNDLLFSRFDSDDLFLEEPLFITAFKIARIIQQNKQKLQNVYMLGFDFDPSSGYSSKIEDFSINQQEFSDYLISSQEGYLREFINFIDSSKIIIKHVGIKQYSFMNADAFNMAFDHHSRKKNQDLQTTGNLFKKYEEIINQGKVIITAEFTTNHFGDIDTLESMVKKAKIDGADLVKVQKRNVEKFYTPEQLDSKYDSPFGKTFRDYRNQLELSDEDFFRLNEICNELEIPWFLSVLDETSFKFVDKISIPVIKLPSTISNFQTFLKAVSDAYMGDVIISTGMTDQNYEKFITNSFKNNSRLFLLQCNSAYPTPPDDCNIAVISHYSALSDQYSNIIPGYSSHDIGSMASCLAVAAGAKMIEKHVKFGNTDWAHFDSVALDLTTNNFKNFVEDIRHAEIIYGSAIKTINPSEHHKY